MDNRSLTIIIIILIILISLIIFLYFYRYQPVAGPTGEAGAGTEKGPTGPQGPQGPTGLPAFTNSITYEGQEPLVLDDDRTIDLGGDSSRSNYLPLANQVYIVQSNDDGEGGTLNLLETDDMVPGDTFMVLVLRGLNKVKVISNYYRQDTDSDEGEQNLDHSILAGTGNIFILTQDRKIFRLMGETKN